MSYTRRKGDLFKKINKYKLCTLDIIYISNDRVAYSGWPIFTTVKAAVVRNDAPKVIAGEFSFLRGWFFLLHVLFDASTVLQL